jgi:hypothetical protein
MWEKKQLNKIFKKKRGIYSAMDMVATGLVKK